MTGVVAVVQARMSSQRFPGKMLAELGGKSLIDWVLARVLVAHELSEVVLATSTNVQDDALVDQAIQHGVTIFRGSETDVLERFVQALTRSKAELVVRICADNPFVAPEEVDRLVSAFKSGEYDYACNHQQRLMNKYADGFGAEILSVELLRKISAIATEPSHREHVTSYLWDNQQEFRLYAVEAPSALAFPDVRLDVDTSEDLSRLDSFVEQFEITTDSSAAQIVAAYNKFSR